MTELSSTISERLEIRLKEAAIAASFSQVDPSYPQIRYKIPGSQYSDGFTIPEGPWDTAEVNLQLPTPEEQRLLLMGGYTLDNYGRPLHPWLSELASENGPGVVTNKGAYRNWGPNKTVDPIILAYEKGQTYILLIQRDDDTQKWALPGGFIDPGEGSCAAGKREAYEESSIELSLEDGVIIGSHIVGDPRATAHSWPETTVVVWNLPERRFIQSGPETLDAAWWPVSEIPGNLFGSHNLLIEEILYGNVTS